MEGKRRVPKRRFRDFSDDWSLIKLEELVEIKGRIGFRGYTKDDIVSKENGGVLTLSPTNIVSNKLTLEVKNTYITEEKYKESPEIMIKNGDILFVKTGSTLGKSALVLDLNQRATINPQLVIMRTNQELQKLLSVLLSSEPIQKQVKSARIGGAVPTLTETEISKFELFIPNSSEEQKSIGEFFKQLDEMITLQERKIEKTKTLKSAYLAEMFPAEGERVPRRRFAGFTDEWKSQKLGDILSVNSGRDYKHLNKGNIPVYGTGGYMLSVDDKLSDVDGIGIGRKGTIDKPQYLKAPFWTVDTLFFMTPIINSDIYFLYSMSQNIDWRNMDESTGVPSLSKKTIEDVSVYIPSFEEQTKIGIIFKKLDETITLHQRKLNKLKALKQAYLNEMFV